MRYKLFLVIVVLFNITPLCFIKPLIAQEEFHLEEAFFVQNQFTGYRVLDIDRNGIDEIVFVLRARTPDDASGHQIGIYSGIDLTFLSPVESEILKTMNVFDFNSDGYQDIIAETYRVLEFEVYSGPDYNLECHGTQYYLGQIDYGADRWVGNGGTIPLVGQDPCDPDNSPKIEW